MENLTSIEKYPIDCSQRPGDYVACLTLRNEKAANAFSGQMMIEIAESLSNLQKDPNLRLLVLRSAGKHFSAGADLNWMQASAKLDTKSNEEEAHKLTLMFEALVNETRLKKSYSVPPNGLFLSEVRYPFLENLTI